MTLHELVDRERREMRRREMLAGALQAAGAVALLLTLGAALLGGARWLALPRVVPFVVWLAVAGAAGAFVWRTRRRVRHGVTRAHVAHAIESEQRLRRGVLLGALELEGHGALAARAAAAARRTLPASGPLAPRVRRTGRRRATVAAGMAGAGLLVFATASPLSGDGLRAVFRPIDAWRGALLAPPAIDSAPSDLLRGSPVRIVVRAPGRRTILLSVRQTGEAWRVDTLVVDPRTGTARWTLDALRADLRLVASDGRASSDSVVIHAAERPFVGSVLLHVVYPSYLSRPAENLPVGEPMRLPRGTAVTITGRASVPLASVALAGDGDERVVLGAAGHAFSGRFVADRSARLRWLAAGPSGPIADVPAPLELEVLADSAPRIEITAPSEDTVFATDQAVPLGLTARDDHGIATVALRIARITVGGDAPPIGQAVAGAAGTSWIGTSSVEAATLQLQPGDAVRVRAEVVDASPWAQRGVSRDLIIKRPTKEESRISARTLGESASTEASAAAAAQRALARRTDEASRARPRADGSQGTTPGSLPRAAPSPQEQKAMDFRSAEGARALAQEQRAMTERVQRLRQATQQLEQQLKAAGALDTALARQLGEAQALLRQALTPELMAQMQKLEDATKAMNGERSRDALRELAQMQQRLRAQLERSAEMLKRAAHEGSMQTLADEARDLAAKERALADSAGAAGDGKDGARSQQAAEMAHRAARLKDAMDELKARLQRDAADAAAARTQQAQEHAKNSESGMRRAASGMRNGEPQQSARGGQQDARDAAAEMQRASQAMQDARDAQVKEWKKELTAELDQAVQEMMQLAREERAIADQATSGTGGEDRRSAQSAVEQGVDKASERLEGAARKSALLSQRSQRAVAEAKGKVSQATRSVSETRNAGSQQATSLREAADALTKAAAALARDRERANSANSASGFSEMLQQMQEMAQKQGQINAQAQGLMSMPNPGSGSGQALARSLARQQRGLAEQLDEAGDGLGGERAAQLAREARMVADALDNGRLDGGTLARQQQLFRRLLDAGRSLEKEEREDSGTREARTASGTEAFTPGAAVPAKAAIRFRPPGWDELRELSTEERRAVLDYFTRINNVPAP